MAEEAELDFNMDDCNSFFYTNEKQIGKMDDEFILSKIIEKYPDFIPTNKDTMVKQAFTLFLNDTKHIKYILDYFDITIHDLFKVIFRGYPYIFSTCFNNKVHDIIKTKAYAKRIRPSR